MKLLISILALSLSFSVTAQTKFVDRIQKDVKGEGSVRLVQDARLTSMLNGDVIPQVGRPKDKTVVVGDGKSVMKVKRRGYRIQVYQGGSSRANKAEAQRVGQQVKQKFDLVPYALFNNPGWVCRVGDFRTREDAAEYLQKVKVVFTGAMIVPSEIYVDN